MEKKTGNSELAELMYQAVRDGGGILLPDLVSMGIRLADRLGLPGTFTRRRKKGI